jgi:hypothetical protein
MDPVSFIKDNQRTKLGGGKYVGIDLSGVWPVLAELFGSKEAREAKQLREAANDYSSQQKWAWQLPEEQQKKLYEATFQYDPGTLRRILRGEKGETLLPAPAAKRTYEGPKEANIPEAPEFGYKEQYKPANQKLVFQDMLDTLKSVAAPKELEKDEPLKFTERVPYYERPAMSYGEEAHVKSLDRQEKMLERALEMDKFHMMDAERKYKLMEQAKVMSPDEHKRLLAALQSGK